MGTLSLVLFAGALVAFVLLMVRAARRRRRTRRLHSEQQSSEDDSPTGYVQGVWLLGGADSAKAHGQHRDPPDVSGHGGGGDDGGGSN
jgi:hypothetical protein